MLNHAMNGNLRVYVGTRGGAGALLHYGAKRTPEMTVDLEYSTEAGTHLYHARLAHTARDALTLAEEAVGSRPDGSADPEPLQSLGAGHTESLLNTAARTDGVARVIHSAMSRWRSHQFHDTSSTAGMRNQCYKHDNHYLRSDAANLAAYLYLLRETDRACYQRIVDTIRLAAPFFGDCDLDLAVNPRNVMLNWHGRDGEYPFGSHRLSDGTLRFIALCTLLLQPKERLPELIVIDEVEIGLHPYAISLVGSMVRSVSHERQVILATQSVSLVDEFAPDGVVAVDQRGGESLFRRLVADDITDWPAEYSVSELWEKSFIGGGPGR